MYLTSLCSWLCYQIVTTLHAVQRPAALLGGIYTTPQTPGCVSPEAEIADALQRLPGGLRQHRLLGTRPEWLHRPCLPLSVNPSLTRRKDRLPSIRPRTRHHLQLVLTRRDLIAHASLYAMRKHLFEAPSLRKCGHLAVNPLALNIDSSAPVGAESGCPRHTRPYPWACPVRCRNSPTRVHWRAAVAARCSTCTLTRLPTGAMCELRNARVDLRGGCLTGCMN